jgi:hypothetical protein
MTSAIDFDGINAAALSRGRSWLQRLIPGGKFCGNGRQEYMVRNPRRNDQHPGSFSINCISGVWKDFSSGDSGSDPISLVAYLQDVSQRDAARQLADMVGVPFLKPNGGYANGRGNSHAATTGSPTRCDYGNFGPPERDDEIRRHYYLSCGVAMKIKIKLGASRFIQWYRVFRNSVPVGWQTQKPVNYSPIPYVTDVLDPFDPELRHDAVFWPEGEKDVQNLNKLNVPAFTFGGVGDGMPDGIAHWLKDRHLVILADNDGPGRDHAEKKAAVAHAAGAASIRIVHFLELPPKGDVSDFIAGGGTLEQLHARIDAADTRSESAATPNDKDTTIEARASWQRAAFTGEQLRLMHFEPLAWIVPQIVPAEGVILLCSRPKFGKSWLAYDLCIGATMDRFILGLIKPAQGDVLYLALEDSKRRLQRRMTKLLPTFKGKWPDKLTITTEWRRLHEGGLDDLRAWYEDAKANGGKPIMVVIDVLAKVRKPTGNKPVYEADYEALTGLHLLSHELGVAIVVVHHTRKMAADDLMETVSGSYGLTGAVDTVIVMANKGCGAVLDVRGRDVESSELAIQFSKDACRWTILGAAAEVHQSDQRKAIMAALVERGEPMGINELVAATGMKRNPLELLLGKMVKLQLIKRTGSGRYAHKDYIEPSERSVRSVRPVSASGQMADRPQSTDKTQENADICPSVRSVQEFTSKTYPTAERVKSQTDQTDGQIGTQVAERKANSGFENLSGPQSDRTDQTEAGAC